MRRSNVGKEFGVGCGWDVGGVGKPLIYTTTTKRPLAEMKTTIRFIAKAIPKIARADYLCEKSPIILAETSQIEKQRCAVHFVLIRVHQSAIGVEYRPIFTLGTYGSRS